MTTRIQRSVRMGLRALLTVLIGSQLILSAPIVHAASFGSADYISGQASTEMRTARIARVQDFLAEDRVQGQLEALGVDPLDAQSRIASLTNAELAQLDARMASLETGSGVVGIVGVVFVVLLILELVGVTNVFTSF